LPQGERSWSVDRAEMTTSDRTIILLGNTTAKDTIGTISGDEIRINYTIKNIDFLGASHDISVAVNVVAFLHNLSRKI
jgi:hypothetical protein